MLGKTLANGKHTVDNDGVYALFDLTLCEEGQGSVHFLEHL